MRFPAAFIDLTFSSALITIIKNTMLQWQQLQPSRRFDSTRRLGQLTFYGSEIAAKLAIRSLRLFLFLLIDHNIESERAGWR